MTQGQRKQTEDAHYPEGLAHRMARCIVSIFTHTFMEMFV